MDVEQKNYTIYHLHTHISNGVAGIDSIDSHGVYVEKAKSLGMKAIAFSEHGSVFNWKARKDVVEKAGLKYIHAIETYITETLDNKIRDNYHCVLIAKNWEGVKEINRLSSKAFNREDGSYYYSPRITFEDLINTSDNVIITTACIASILYKGEEPLKQRFIEFLKRNPDRCFLEIQHHNTDSQKQYNQYLWNLSKETGLRLIAGTDTHALNAEHAEGRVVLQKGKNIFFDDENGWDLTFKTYDELVEAYRTQGVLPEKVYLQAIENTNVMADMVEPFTLDTSFKYPKISNNSVEEFRKRVFKEENIQKIVNEGFSREQVLARLNEEFDTFVAVDACDYGYLQNYITKWCHEHDIWTGPARGSAATSLTLYALGVTEVNPLKYDLKFWRFMSPDKYSLAD